MKLKLNKRISIILMIITFLVVALGIALSVHGETTTNTTGSNVEATFDSATGVLTIRSTSGKGTMDDSDFDSFKSTIGVNKVKTVTFANAVYAPENSLGLFYNFENLTSINNLSNLDTSNVTDMSDMFDGCKKLTSLDLSKFNTSKVTNMEWMFTDCTALSTLNISSFDTSNVENMYNMFKGCSSLTSITFGNIDTSSVMKMDFMFSGCEKLNSLDLSKFDTSSVESMVAMFKDTKKITSLDLSKFNTSEVTDMKWMFDGCESLTSINLSSFNTSNVTNMCGMFENCSSMQNLDLSKFNMSKVTDVEDMFLGCNTLNQLKTAYLTSTVEITLPSEYTNASDTTDTKRYASIKIGDFNGSVTLAKVYVVTLYKNDGTVNSGDINGYTYGKGATLPTDITRPGYVFDGWYDNEGFTGSKVTSIPSSAVGDKQFYAKWVYATNTPYKVEYYLQNLAKDGYDIDATQTVTKQGTTNDPVQINNTDIKAIKGFTYEENNSSNVLSGVIAADGNFSLKLHYTRNYYSNIEIIDTEGNVVGTVEGEYGKEVTLPTPEKEGYTFDGWYDNSDFTGNAIDKIRIEELENIVLYDKWVPNSNTKYTIEYYLRSLDNEVEGYELIEDYTEEKQGTTDTTANVIATDIKDINGFSYDSQNENNVLSGNIEPDGSLILKVYYSRNTYSISFETSGGRITDSNIPTEYLYGVGVGLPSEVDKSDSVFLGWYDNAELKGTLIDSVSKTDFGNKTFYARWSDENEFFMVSRVYDINDTEKIISKIAHNTDLNTLKANIKTNGEIKVYNNKGIEISGTDLVGTGYRLDVTFNGETEIYHLVVKCDTSGDGKITITDLSQLNQHLIGIKALTGLPLIAADVDENGTTTITDLSKINQHLMGIRSI